jgi:regulator of extracellular matrix RemA (YlzA/DUF370 family)
MFLGLFRGRTKDAATERIFQHLGESSKGILSAASEGNDLAVAVKGDAVVSAIIAESVRVFGLTIKPNTIFARFVSAAQEEDFAKLAQMTKGMANALKAVPDRMQRGCLIHSWINGNN